jgi:hypothetical protein
LDGLRVFVFVLVALALWPIDDTALLSFYFLLRQFDLGRDVHGDVFCACEALAVSFCLSSNHCILGERAWDIWTFMT